jgi:hypothetical protein
MLTLPGEPLAKTQVLMLKYRMLIIVCASLLTSEANRALDRH